MRHEPGIRLAFFFAVLFAIALWETLAPRRRRTTGRALRWSSNLGVVVIDSVVARMIVPAGVVGFALYCEAHGWGLLHALGSPLWLAVTVTVVVLDLVVYLQHVMFHAVPLLWRIHRMHHADLDFDVTTGVRFHPLEILISLGIKLAAVAAVGAPALGVLAFEVALNATSMFNHSNVAIPEVADRAIRMILVTPDMHRVHHSVVVRETNSNFGFNLPWWDRLLGTYRAQPAAGHLAMTIGLDDFRDARELRLDRMLWQPLRGQPGAYPING
ncbi:MAG: sterol desaturase family protein [Candidatus Binataceae bacterium]